MTEEQIMAMDYETELNIKLREEHDALWEEQERRWKIEDLKESIKNRLKNNK